MARSREEECRIYNACLPHASAKSAMCQEVDAGMASGFPENRCSVFMTGVYFSGEIRVFLLWEGITSDSFVAVEPGFEEACGYSSAPWIPSVACRQEIAGETFGNAFFTPCVQHITHIEMDAPQQDEQRLVLKMTLSMELLPRTLKKMQSGNHVLLPPLSPNQTSSKGLEVL